MFEAFHRKQRETTDTMSCHCAGCSCACQMVLKFVVHHGTFGEHVIRGMREIIGPEVILLHRLLKNTVAVREYALFTDALGAKLRSIGLPLTGHRERYDHIGDVAASVWDLAPLCAGAH
jgi:hypothetical protein